VGAGAYDFLCKPIDMEELKLLLGRCIYVAELERIPSVATKRSRGGFRRHARASPQMQAVFAYIRKVAKATAPVLLLGESGTGKEMAALAIHRRSSRKDAPLCDLHQRDS
jgi:two-component system NtrC family response regulator